MNEDGFGLSDFLSQGLSLYGDYLNVRQTQASNASTLDSQKIAQQQQAAAAAAQAQQSATLMRWLIIGGVAVAVLVVGFFMFRKR